MEVGLGGTLDATNVITPIVSVITRLDFEHTAILGNTMPEIAANKAGIIKPGNPGGDGRPASRGGRDVIARAGRGDGSDLLIAGRDWRVAGDDTGFRVEGPWWHYDDLTLALPGAHQRENAGLAIAASRGRPSAATTRHTTARPPRFVPRCRKRHCLAGSKSSSVVRTRS